MNLAHLTPTRETCNALEAAGFPQNTVFVWARTARRDQVVLRELDARRGHGAGSAAPTLSEMLAHLPAHLDFPLPHPIFGLMDRTHTLAVSMGSRTEMGYGRVGALEVQHRTAHESAVEVAARLYLALHAAGRLPAMRDPVQIATASGDAERLAYAA